ncbi:MAG: Tm-1-like ATP-binding domain-containing protein [Zestosphaera sp.]
MSLKRPVIAILVTLDTKEGEGFFLKERIEANGGLGFLIDISMRKHEPRLGKADVSNELLVKLAGYSIEELNDMDRADAQEIIARGALTLLKSKVASGEVDGVVGIGGSTGLGLVSMIMRELPMLMPKIVVTTAVSEACSAVLGSDITIVWSITDFSGGTSLNSIEAEVLNKVAAMIVKASSPTPVSIEKKPMILASQFGNTTPFIMVSKEILSSKGYDFVSFHALGRTGGYVLEKLISSGVAVGVLDATTHELTDELFGGVLNASVGGVIRLTTAGKLGVPQVVLPGGVDQIVFWKPESVPEKFRSRCVYEHSKGLVTLVRATGDELYAVGKLMAERLNMSKGPTVVVFPLRGFGIIDNDPNIKPVNFPSGAYCQELVFHEDKVVFKRTNKPWFNKESNLQFLKALLEYLDLSKPNIDLIVVDHNINEPEVAILSSEILHNMIKGVWRKGWIPRVPNLRIIQETN